MIVAKTGLNGQKMPSVSYFCPEIIHGYRKFSNQRYWLGMPIFHIELQKFVKDSFLDTILAEMGNNQG